MASKPERRKVWLIGRLGSGLTMAARAIAEESRLRYGEGVGADISYNYRVSGQPAPGVAVAPFRAPHSTVQPAQLTGTMRGHHWRVGELSLAHGGVLYMHDATDFGLFAIELVASAWRHGSVSLRSNLASGIEGRAGESNALVIPTWFSLVVSTAPCPCGNRGASGAPCLCSDRDIENFHAKVRPLVEGAEVVRL